MPSALATAEIFNWLSSRIKIATRSQSTSRSPARTISSNTGVTSVGDPLMTSRMLALAVWRASEDCVSLNSCAFWMAMTAWSAKLCARSVSSAENARACERAKASVPSSRSLFEIGIYSVALTPKISRMSFSCSGSSTADQSGMCRISPDTMARDGKFLSGSTSTTGGPMSSSGPSRDAPAAGENVLPSLVITIAISQSSNRTAAATMASNTGMTSVCAPLITRRISALAVCRTKAVWVSLNRREF